MKFRIAMCGCSGHAVKFARLINSYPESEVSAVWDPDPNRANSVAAELQCSHAKDYELLLADPTLSGVVITTPNCMHTEMILQAAQAGKHVFVEKPLCTDLEDALRIREALHAAGVKFYMSDPFVNASTTYVRDFLRAGKLGTVLGVRIHFSDIRHLRTIRTPDQIRTETLQMGGGMMSDTGGHPLHILLHLLGMPKSVSAVFAYGGDAARVAGSEEYITMLMRYPNEISAVVEAGMISPNYLNRVTVFGTGGIIEDTRIEDHSTSVRYRLTGEENWNYVPAEELRPDPEDHVRYWIRMLAEDIPNHRVGVDPESNHGLGIDDAVRLVALRAAVYEAAASQKTVMVEYFDY